MNIRPNELTGSLAGVRTVGWLPVAMAAAPVIGSLFGGGTRAPSSTVMQSQNVNTSVSSSTNVVVGGGTVAPSPAIDPSNVYGLTGSFNPMGTLNYTTPTQIATALNPAPDPVSQPSNTLLIGGTVAAIIAIILVAKFSKR